MSHGSAQLKFEPASASPKRKVMRRISSTVEKLRKELEWEDELAFRVNLALEELAANALTHGRVKGELFPEIEISIVSSEQRLIITITDSGNAFNPLSDAPPPPIPGGPDADAPVGGMGIHLVKSMMDGMTYRRVGDRNQVTLTALRNRGF